MGAADGLCNPWDLWADLAQFVAPPERLRVSQAAARYLRVMVDGRDMGTWNPDYAPHLLEPMDALESRDYHTVCVVGPARGGKTMALVDSWVLYSVLVDPGDMGIVATSREEARDFSGSRIAAVHDACPEVAALLTERASDRTTWDIHYRHGTILRLLYATKAKLRGKTIRRMALPDYDGIPQAVRTEGSPYEMSWKRTETYRSAGMTLVESSPGYPIARADWKPATPHEAPPAAGILSIYNQGTRARRYWGCDCGHWFEPSFALLHWDGVRIADLALDGGGGPEDVEGVVMVCPECGQSYAEQDGRALNRRGLWVHDGQRIEAGRVVGARRKSKIASYWFKGPVSSASNWDAMANKHLAAYRTFQAGGGEEPLISTTQQDQGEPYLPRAYLRDRTTAALSSRLEPLARGEVPVGVRYLVVAVDVQARRFPLAVWGFGLGMEAWLIERIDLHFSARSSPSGEWEPVDPAAYQEDWRVLTPYLSKGWPLADGSGRVMRPALLVCDSGGRAGVTPRAYGWWRELRAAGLHRSALLLKGDPSMALDGGRQAPRTADTDEADLRRRSPRIRLAYPDSSDRSDRNSGARGDVPVLQLYSDALKDELSAALDRTDPGPGYVHLPQWAPDELLAELTAEQRGPRGWRRPQGVANELWDQAAYARAGALHLGAETIRWDAPPVWAADWDRNPLVARPETGAAPVFGGGGRRVRSPGRM